MILIVDFRHVKMHYMITIFRYKLKQKKPQNPHNAFLVCKSNASNFFQRQSCFEKRSDAKHVQKAYKDANVQCNIDSSASKDASIMEETFFKLANILFLCKTSYYNIQ